MPVKLFGDFDAKGVFGVYLNGFGVFGTNSTGLGCGGEWGTPLVPRGTDPLPLLYALVFRHQRARSRCHPDARISPRSS